MASAQAPKADTAPKVDATAPAAAPPAVPVPEPIEEDDEFEEFKEESESAQSGRRDGRACPLSGHADGAADRFASAVCGRASWSQASTEPSCCAMGLHSKHPPPRAAPAASHLWQTGARTR